MSTPVNPPILCLTGLPRSGATLLSQLLAQHPDVHSTGYTSPLCDTLNGLRQHLSHSSHLYTHLDADFNPTYQRLISAYQGFMAGWFSQVDTAWAVDKNNDWLSNLEMLSHLGLNFRMVVMVRELGQIYGSIETQHQKTLLLDPPNQLAGLSRDDRAQALFEPSGPIGSPLAAISALQDVDSRLQQQLYYVVYEHLVQEPVTVIQKLFEWLDLAPAQVTPQNLKIASAPTGNHSHYKTHSAMQKQVQPIQQHVVPGRIQATLRQNFAWYYNTFYPNPEA
ncbi:MAG: sulfotransferase [Leptolyngbyaceae cyanobacterium MAG.088]|nr:sulfotransferase [Leptolyngbyaceae cyanobacterium MAG.088]